ncbi:abscission/NoCut checkpoint regulator isoform X1 [Leptopilina boulardi]|uniref:abscission/NoCut checkpoint regulator isoform X1 n=2 Tax=Leptopilina boulardi TaxID=63433 RepID=UPI0021F5C692|nr:abscission/NoCut checkpoint regulator isoform X1 [Leptopilina boulardi]
MSCNTCQSKFSLFLREKACPNCGFSYCSKCLKYKCEVPKVGLKKVCGPCFSKKMDTNTEDNNSTNLHTIMDQNNEPLAPVDITNKLDSLENPAKPPIVMYAHGKHWDKLKIGLEPADQEIVDRLRKLKDEDGKTSPPSVEDIKRRLALLKDQNPDVSHKPMNIHYVDNRSDQEKTDDLIKEYLTRLELAARNDPIAEIQSRLNYLKDPQPSTSSSSIHNAYYDDEDEASITKRIIKKALAEAALEKKYGDVDEIEDMEVETAHMSTDDEDEACVMCDQTTDLIRCQGCHNDLYCTLCFADNHDDFELGSHTVVPFKPKKKSS